MKFIFLKLCFSICLLMSTKGLKGRTELYVDAALGYNQYAGQMPNYGPNYNGQNGFNMYRHANGPPKDECVTKPPQAPKDSAPDNPDSAGNAPGAGKKEPGAGQNGAGSNAAGPPSGIGNNAPPPSGGGAPSGGGGMNSHTGGGSNVGGEGGGGGNGNSFPMGNAITASTTKLHALVQHIYAAQARVQLEATEIRKAQGVATAAQKSLEEASNNVRVITAALQSAQQEVAAAAVRAQTAQLQLAAHDQLLFAARQKVDALSAQMVGLQAEDGIVLPHSVFNIQALFNQLREPLPMSQTPTPVPAIDNAPPTDDGSKNSDSKDSKGLMDYEDYYIGVH